MILIVKIENKTDLVIVHIRLFSFDFIWVSQWPSARTHQYTFPSAVLEKQDYFIWNIPSVEAFNPLTHRPLFITDLDLRATRFILFWYHDEGDTCKITESITLLLGHRK